MEDKELIYELKNKIKQLQPELEKAIEQIKSINNSLSNISTYSIDKLIEVVHKVNNMSEADKKLMVDLINLTQVKSE